MTLHLKSIILAFSICLFQSKALFLTPEEFKVKILKNLIIIPDFNISKFQNQLPLILGVQEKQPDHPAVKIFMENVLVTSEYLEMVCEV